MWDVKSASPAGYVMCVFSPSIRGETCFEVFPKKSLKSASYGGSPRKLLNQSGGFQFFAKLISSVAPFSNCNTQIDLWWECGERNTLRDLNFVPSSQALSKLIQVVLFAARRSSNLSRPQLLGLPLRELWVLYRRDAVAGFRRRGRLRRTGSQHFNFVWVDDLVFAPSSI